MNRKFKYIARRAFYCMGDVAVYVVTDLEK